MYQLRPDPIPNTRRIAVANHKGGAAKTTTAVNLAAGLAKRGRRVMLLDLDPQANASAWLGGGGDAGVYAILTDNRTVESQLTKSVIDGVALVTASPRLAGAERVLASELAAETTLKRRLQNADLSRWDYVIFDTPPALNLLTINALTAADEVLVPVEAHVLALSGVAQIVSTIELVQSRLNPKLASPRFLLCRFDPRTRHSSEVRDSLTAKFGAQVLTTIIRENVRLAEAPSFSEPIESYAPSSQGAVDYGALAMEIIGMETIA